IAFAGGNPVQIASDIDSPITFSPDGNKLAFERFDVSQGKDFMLIGNDENNSIAGQIAFPQNLNGKLDWSPDGRSILVGVIKQEAAGVQKIGFAAFIPDESLFKFGQVPQWGWTSNHIAISSDHLLVVARGVNPGSEELYQLNWREGTSTPLVHEGT